MSLSKKPKTPTQNENFGQKTWSPRFLECAEHNVFRLFKKICFLGYFCFFDKGTPNFDWIKADDFKWNKAVKWYKIRKSQLFHGFL